MTSLGSPTNGGRTKHSISDRRDGIRPLVPLPAYTLESLTGPIRGDAGQGGAGDSAGAFPRHPKRASHMFTKHLHLHTDLGLDPGQARGEPQSRYVEPAPAAWPAQDRERREYRAFQSAFGTKIFLRWLLHPVSLGSAVQARSQLFAARPTAVLFANLSQLSGLTGARRIP